MEPASCVCSLGALALAGAAIAVFPPASTKVRRLALQNAASLAGLPLTTEVMVAVATKDEERKHGMSDMGDMV